MPQLHYGRSPDGLIVPVVVGLDDDLRCRITRGGSSHSADCRYGDNRHSADLTGYPDSEELAVRSMGQAKTIGVRAPPIRICSESV
jgi:hypothetical protein